uniref:Uncharacterized protein n=1 Tax=Rhizophora mucronata TaxID=61149 RepID=A0A2P2QQU1_RHIMU
MGLNFIPPLFQCHVLFSLLFSPQLQ